MSAHRRSPSQRASQSSQTPQSPQGPHSSQGSSGDKLQGERLLLIEDDESLREVLSINLEGYGLLVDGVKSAEEALELAKRGMNSGSPYRIALTDIKLPKMSGLELIAALKSIDARIKVIVLTAFGGTEPALEAMRLGAFHYVEKPVNLGALTAELTRALDHHELTQAHSHIHDRVQLELVASSPAMNEVLRVVDRVACASAPVMILGESGVGKELIARALHERSDRASAPFITVNCAAIPSALLESVLFGHERGAFTGAQTRRDGKFSAASGGTLFLDEIAEMSPALQAKLLRVLQDGLVERVGSITPELVDVRVVTATHRDLTEVMSRGEFRRDLYYRLNVIPILIPPLRRRPEDIPVLIRHFIRQLTRDSVKVSEAVDSAFLRYQWPGNVRELRNLIERMLLLREGDELGVCDLPLELRGALERSTPLHGELGADASKVIVGELSFDLPPDQLDLKELERAVIRATLERHEGNQSASARYLNIPRHALIYRLSKSSEDDK